ncbi:MAG: T9SS type A sorting domain-containing protein [Bacteroidota bacterium]
MFTLITAFSGISAFAQIEITAPKNSSAITAGKDVRIEWKGAANAPVSLYYSTDKGTAWTSIADNITTDFYIWNPNITAAEILLKAELVRQGDVKKIWEIPADNPEMHQQEVRSAVFSPDGKFILSASTDSEFKVWDIALKKSESYALTGVSRIYTPQFLHSNDVIVCGADSTIAVFNRNTNLLSILGRGAFTSLIRAVVVHPFKNILAVAEVGGTVRVWDIDLKRELASFKEPDFTAYTIAFSNDGEQIAVAGDNSSLLKSRIYIRKWENSTEFTTLEGHGDNGTNRTIWSVHFSPDGKHLVSGGVDKTVRIWNIEKASEENVFKSNTFHVRSVKFSPDGKRVMSGALDSTIRQWEVSSGAEITAPANHNGQILAVDYSSSGDTILSTGRDRTLKLWKNAAGGVENSTITLLLKNDTIFVADTVCAADKRNTAFGEKTAIIVVFPNPAPVNATINFTLAEDATAALKLLDMKGNLVKTFFTESFKSGRYERVLNFADVPNGAYIIQLQTPTQTADWQVSVVK